MPRLEELATLVDGEPVGDPELEITGVSEIQQGRPGTITFLANPRYAHYAADTSASAIVVSDRNILGEKAGIVVQQPQVAIARILGVFQPRLEYPVGIHPTAVVDQTARLGRDVVLGPFVVVGKGAALGDNSILEAGVVIGQDATIGANVHFHPRVTIYHHCQVGDNTIIHAGTEIGSDGFGFVTVNDRHHKIPQNGRVIIGKNVELGANCTIDRGTIGDTTIGDECKFDNQVHIAHNVRIGRGCLIAGQVGVAGSAVIGDYCIFAGHVGIAPHLTIGDHTICAAKAGVTKSLSGGKIYAGMPAREIREQNKRDAILTAVALLKKRILKLEDALASRN